MENKITPEIQTNLARCYAYLLSLPEPGKEMPQSKSSKAEAQTPSFETPHDTTDAILSVKDKDANNDPVA